MGLFGSRGKKPDKPVDSQPAVLTIPTMRDLMARLFSAVEVNRTNVETVKLSPNNFRRIAAEVKMRPEDGFTHWGAEYYQDPQLDDSTAVLTGRNGGTYRIGFGKVG